MPGVNIKQYEDTNLNWQNNAFAKNKLFELLNGFVVSGIRFVCSSSYVVRG